jgi:hypothetical protein
MTEKKTMKHEASEKISEELSEVYKKKIKSMKIDLGGATLDRSSHFSTLEEYIEKWASAPPDFMIVEFEDGSEVGILKGKQLFSPQVYRSLLNKLKESVKKVIYDSPNGIKNEKIDEVLPKLLFSAVDPNTGEPYLSEIEKTLAKELRYPNCTTNWIYICELLSDNEIRVQIIPSLGRMYFPTKK